MWGYFCIRFIDFMLKLKSLRDYINLFSPNYYENNHKIMLKYFQENRTTLKCIAMFAINIENPKSKLNEIEVLISKD